MVMKQNKVAAFMFHNIMTFCKYFEINFRKNYKNLYVNQHKTTIELKSGFYYCS